MQQNRMVELDKVDALRLSRDECWDRVEELEIALCESLVLQSHYATLLNRFDDGERLTFATARDWIERLRLIGRLPR